MLFVGNTYTHGRVNPVMGYNAANVHDLTAAMWVTNPSGSNTFEPHPWGGVVGIFKQFTVQAGLGYDYVDKIEDFVHNGAAHSYRERDVFPGATTTEQTTACQAATGTSANGCNTLRTIPANSFASLATQV